MKLTDWVIYGGLALGAHVAVIVWTTAPQGGDTGSGGARGADSVSVTAATPQIANMIAKWTQSPDLPDDMSPSQQMRQVQPDSSINGMPPDRPNDPPIAPQPPVRMDAETQDMRPQAPEPVNMAPILSSDIATLSALSVPTPSDPAPRDMAPARTPDVQRPSRPRQNTQAPTPATPPQLDRATADPIAPAAHQSIPDTRPKPRPASLPQIAQTAKGNGNTQQAANSNKPKPAKATNTSAKLKSDTAAWATQIHNAIERKKFYPKGTRARGRVVIDVTIDRNGRLLQASIVQPSGFGVLDRAALEAVKRARFPKAPESLQQPRYNFRIPIKLSGQ